MLQFVAVHCNVLQFVAVRCGVFQCVAVRCSVLQCVAKDLFVGANNEDRSVNVCYRALRQSLDRHGEIPVCMCVCVREREKVWECV